jgi:hypothetical protein
MAGDIVGIGPEPTGYVWTGMQSHSADGSGYVVAFRELDPRHEAPLELWWIAPGRYRFEALAPAEAEDFEAEAGPDRRVTFRAAERRSFVFYRYEPSNGKADE